MNLLYKGKGRKLKQLDVIWEEIVRKNNEENGNLDFNNYFQCLKTYADLVNEYITVKACLLKLTKVSVDAATIEVLEDFGYILEVTTMDSYKKSLQIVTAKSDNLITKIMSKHKELQEFNKNKSKPLTFAKALMQVGVGLGYSVSKDITLAEYNEAKKLIKEKHGRNSNTGRNKSSKRSYQ